MIINICCCPSYTLFFPCCCYFSLSKVFHVEKLNMWMVCVCVCLGKFCHIVLFCFNFWVLFLFAFYLSIQMAPPISCWIFGVCFFLSRIYTTFRLLTVSNKICVWSILHRETNTMCICMDNMEPFKSLPYDCNFCLNALFIYLFWTTFETLVTVQYQIVICSLLFVFVYNKHSQWKICYRIFVCVHSNKIKYKLIGTEK